MRQQDFASAITYFTQAEQNGYKAKIVEDALANSRFWLIMSEATQAFSQNQFDVADQKFRAALAIDPRSAEALNGLAGLYIKEQQYTTAAIGLPAPHQGSAHFFRRLARPLPRQRARRSKRSGSCHRRAIPAQRSRCPRQGSRIPPHSRRHLSGPRPHRRRRAHSRSRARSAVSRQRQHSQRRHQAPVRRHSHGGQTFSAGRRAL